MRRRQRIFFLAQFDLAQGHADASVAQLQHCLSLRPENATAYYDLSRAYRILGNRPAMTQALTNYQRTSKDAKASTYGFADTGDLVCHLC